MPNGEQMGFREWVEHYEKEQDSQRAQIGELTKIVSSLSADVKSLVENQRGLFSRVNRPAPVAAYVSALLASIAVMISFSALLVDPIKDNMFDLKEALKAEELHNLEVHKALNAESHENAIRSAVNQEALRWLENLEDRYDKRIHEDSE